MRGDHHGNGPEKAPGESRPASRPSRNSTWEIARLFPAQGDWSEEEYFALDTNHLVEYSDGFLEFLPMPTIFHQLILQFLYEKLEVVRRAEQLGDRGHHRLQGPTSSAQVP